MLRTTLTAALLAASTTATADDCPCKALFAVLSPSVHSSLKSCYREYVKQETPSKQKAYLRRCDTDGPIDTLLFVDRECRPDKLAGRLNAALTHRDMFDSGSSSADYYDRCRSAIASTDWLSGWQLPELVETNCRKEWVDGSLGWGKTTVCDQMWVPPPKLPEDVILENARRDAAEYLKNAGLVE